MNFKTFTDWLRRRAYGESSGTPMRLHEDRFHGPHFIDVYYMDHPKPRVGCKCPGKCERPGHGR